MAIAHAGTRALARSGPYASSGVGGHLYTRWAACNARDGRKFPAATMGIFARASAGHLAARRPYSVQSGRANDGRRRRKDWYESCLAADKCCEGGRVMWRDLIEGNCVLVECPSRWYLGKVSERTTMTVRLSDGLVAHTIGDLGLFLSGKVSTSCELTPLPRDIEINLANIDTVQPYPEDMLRNVRRRTHAPVAERSPDSPPQGG